MYGDLSNDDFDAAVPGIYESEIDYDDDLVQKDQYEEPIASPDEDMSPNVNPLLSKAKTTFGMGANRDMKTKHPKQCAYCQKDKLSIGHAIDGKETWWQSPTLATAHLSDDRTVVSQGGNK